MELSQTYTQTLFVMAHLPDSEAPLFLLVARPLTVHPRNIRSVPLFLLKVTLKVSEQFNCFCVFLKNFIRVHVVTHHAKKLHDFYSSLVRVPKQERLCNKDNNSCDCGRTHTILFPIHRILAVCVHKTKTGRFNSSMQLKTKLPNHPYDLFEMVKVKESLKVWEFYKEHRSIKFDDWFAEQDDLTDETN